jgi:protein-S-isoprenylcysteine O-methyltransferase Ste14
MEALYFPYLLIGGLVSAGIVFGFLFFVPAPYGRYLRAGWGPQLGVRLGWVLMESVSCVGFALWFFTGGGPYPAAAWILLILWESHYVYRAFVFPFRLHRNGKGIPLLIVASGMVFNVYNGYINGRYVGAHAAEYATEWLRDPRFWIGVALFVAGLAVNRQSDRILFELRRGRNGYGIPRGGMYRWISCPNYFGETVQWIGWAVATWSLPGLVFAVWTIANLAPRAHAHHRWYLGHFAEYPAERKAFVPFVF